MNKLKEKKKETKLIYHNLPFISIEAYKMLRTNILYSFTEEVSCPVIGITSSIKGEGKSVTSINLAYSLAQTDKKVLFIEADMRMPSLGKHLNIYSKLGVSSILTGIEKNITKIVIKDEVYPNLSFILSGPIPPNPSELLGSSSLEKLLLLLKEQYDYIILDLPPVSLVPDPIVVSRHVDGMILVTRENYSEKKVLIKSIKQLKYVKTKILGIVYRDKDYGTGYTRRNKKYAYEYVENENKR